MAYTLSATARLWLGLSFITGRSPAFWLKLLEQLNCTVDELPSWPRKALLDKGLHSTEINALSDSSGRIEEVQQWLANDSCRRVIHIGEDDYPQSLTQLDSPPLVLFCWGNTACFNRVQLAIVGSRKATYQGLATTREFAQALGHCGVNVVSGLALGIDGAAHQGACSTQGQTLAVLGAGFDHLYPKSHTSLAAKILDEGGCLVSEFAPWVTVKPYHFPRRNRVIAALSEGVVIVEAKVKSGSMITANLAAELGKEVFAVPGSIKNALSAGPHLLIQQGAKLTATIEDIFAELPIVSQSIERPCEPKANTRSLSSVQHRILGAIQRADMTADEIAAQTGLALPAVMANLLELELYGLISLTPAGYSKHLSDNTT